MSECIICNKSGIFKVKGEKIFYCKEHAEEFFEKDALENISKLQIGVIESNKLQEFLSKK